MLCKFVVKETWKLWPVDLNLIMKRENQVPGIRLLYLYNIYVKLPAIFAAAKLYVFVDFQSDFRIHVIRTEVYLILLLIYLYNFTKLNLNLRSIPLFDLTIFLKIFLHFCYLDYNPYNLQVVN